MHRGRLCAGWVGRSEFRGGGVRRDEVAAVSRFEVRLKSELIRRFERVAVQSVAWKRGNHMLRTETFEELWKANNARFEHRFGKLQPGTMLRSLPSVHNCLKNHAHQ
jgi:hypothetical protein